MEGCKLAFEGTAQSISQNSVVFLSKHVRRLSNKTRIQMPNWSFNADANTGHAFGILMACVGALRTSCSGAG
jgi:hypothetical protein